MTAIAFCVAAGGAALLRLAASTHLNKRHLMPWGTLLVNLTGSLALGLLASAAPPVVTVAGAGALGTYTTFSKFAIEVDTLTREGAVGVAAGYVLLSAGGCVLAAWAGLRLG